MKKHLLIALSLVCITTAQANDTAAKAELKSNMRTMLSALESIQKMSIMLISLPQNV